MPTTQKPSKAALLAQEMLQGRREALAGGNTQPAPVAPADDWLRRYQRAPLTDEMAMMRRVQSEEREESDRKVAARREWAAVVPSRWVADLERVHGGELLTFEWYQRFRITWAARATDQSGIMFGAADAGKSVAAAEALRIDMVEHGLSGAWLDAGELPALLDMRRATGRSQVLSDARHAGSLVIDEVGGILQAPWAVWHELDALVKYRFARRRPVLLLTAATTKQMRQRFGPEFARRFTLRFGAEKEDA